jgi:O-antigen/teichoic acid export membrane protein
LFNFLLATLIIVPISLLQAAAPWLTLLPFGAGYEGHPAIVQWLMLHAVAYALLFPMGSILISMGRMWFSWWVNLVYALIFAGASLQLVPRFGAVGYAAALVVAYVLSNIACVVFLYREMPQIMRYLRWAAVALSVALLFGTCVAVSARTGLAVSIITGLTGAALFLTIKLYLHRSSIRGLKPAATTKL